MEIKAVITKYMVWRLEKEFVDEDLIFSSIPDGREYRIKNMNSITYLGVNLMRIINRRKSRQD